ncbi:hypothetical protein EYC84_010823 [Monilinia fructicola]|uniref:C2H2-type domain-containing protein n=3 Tax=Monilinia fructicola TaxID=38448 RepID=A0A5M9J9Q8_MONFR|nr:hypothetical protein EYC84_010823 [Monilinia fructicola]
MAMVWSETLSLSIVGLPQPLSRKAPRPLSSHSSPRAKSYLPLDQQTVIKQEPYDNNPFVFDQYHGNHIQGNHLQRPSDSNWSSIFNPYWNNTSTSTSRSTSTSTRTRTRVCNHNNIVNQEIFQPIQKSNPLQYTTSREYIQAAAPSIKQMLLAMSHNLTSNSQDISSSKSPALPQGSYRIEGITDDRANNNSASHTQRFLPAVSHLQPSITTVGSPDQAEGREHKKQKKQEKQNEGGTQDDDVLLLSVAGTNTSPHHVSAQGKHQFEAGSQSQGYQQLHYQESNNQLQSDQAGLYERGEQIPYEYLPDPNFFQNYDPTRSNNNMSLSYESRAFMPDTQYPMQMAHETQEQDEFKPHDEPHYPSPPPPMSENPYTAQPMTETPEHQVLELPELPKDEEEAPSPGRSKPVPKPDREKSKIFNRKCEWSKHMDKHDRPYRCKETGCEKLPGFTYSGGLLRHEREVHGKHGGPKKQLNCPHPNCKRHTGKGFSRQENLNEHLRRVHTDGVMSQITMEETEEDASQAVITGMKRKRGNSKEDTNELEALREEIKKIKAENDELKRNSQAQQAQTAEVMRQLVELQNLATLQHPRMNAPQANMCLHGWEGAFEGSSMATCNMALISAFSQNASFWHKGGLGFLDSNPSVFDR